MAETTLAVSLCVSGGGFPQKGSIGEGYMTIGQAKRTDDHNGMIQK